MEYWITRIRERMSRSSNLEDKLTILSQEKAQFTKDNTDHASEDIWFNAEIRKIEREIARNNDIEIAEIMAVEISKLLASKAGENREDENSDSISKPNIDDILNSMLTLSSIELETFKKNLAGNDSYMAHVYVGTKESLHANLKGLKNAGIEKKEIMRVFPKYVRWKKNNTCTISDKLTAEGLNKKI